MKPIYISEEKKKTEKSRAGIELPGTHTHKVPGMFEADGTEKK